MMDLLPHRLGNAQAAHLGKTFQPGRHVDDVAVEIAVAALHIAEMYSDAEADLLLRRALSGQFAEAGLKRQSVAQRRYGGAELDHGSVAEGLHHLAAMLRRQPAHDGEAGLHERQCRNLIGHRVARILHRIRKQDRLQGWLRRARCHGEVLSRNGGHCPKKTPSRFRVASLTPLRT